MKRIFLILLVILLLTSCSNKPDVLDIIIKTNEKYKNMQDFKATKIVKEMGYIITSIKEIEIKGNKYKIIEDDEVELSDGKNVWSYNIYGSEPSKLYFPENNSNLDLNNLYFIWDRQGSYKYVFQIDEKRDFSSLSLPTLVKDGIYYWRVYPVDVNGKFDESSAEIREFRVKSDLGYKFKSPDYLSKIFMVYDKTKSRVYRAFPLSEDIINNPLTEAYNSITIEKSTSNLLASISKKGDEYIIDENRVNEDLELEIKDNLLLQGLKAKIINKNKIIIDETVNLVTQEYIDGVQFIDKLLDIYSLNFKVKDIYDNFYIIEGKEAKERLKYSLPWSKVRVWINREDYSIAKLEFYHKVDRKDVLFITLLYEDISFNNNFSDEEFMLVKNEEEKTKE